MLAVSEATGKQFSRVDLRREIARQLLKAKEDPVYYFSRLKTIDEDEPDPKKRVKLYPIHKDYLQNLILLAEHEKRLAVYKARRMMVTWTMCGIASREVLFRPGAHIAFISKKEEDAGKLVGKVKFIYENLPAYWRLGLPIPQYYRAKKAIYIKMICHHPDGPDSVLEAFPEGGEQLVGDGYTLIYWDEVGKIDSDLAAITYGDSLPALGQHGRLIMSSTPPRYPQHFWYKLVQGEYLGQ